MSAPKPSVRHASYLSPPDFHRLDWACGPVQRAYPHCVVLVGSVLTRPDFRDIDVRCVVSDRKFKQLGGRIHEGDGPSSGPGKQILLLNIAVSHLIASSAALPWPIDFQFQPQSEAARESGLCNPMGVR